MAGKHRRRSRWGVSIRDAVRYRLVRRPGGRASHRVLPTFPLARIALIIMGGVVVAVAPHVRLTPPDAAVPVPAAVAAPSVPTMVCEVRG